MRPGLENLWSLALRYADFKKLSAQAQRLVRYNVADSSEELITGVTLRAP